MTTVKNDNKALNYADGINNSSFMNTNKSSDGKSVGVLQAWSSEFGTVKAQRAITK